MSGNRVRDELAQVEAELGEAQAEHAMLTARVEGLKARQAALRQAVAAENGRGASRDEIARMTKNEAIVAVVDRPMRIDDVVEALHAAGREQESYMPVSMYLGELVRKGRLARIRHGLYGPA